MDSIHAPEEILARVKAETRRRKRPSGSFVRYAAAAAAVMVALGGGLGMLLSDMGKAADEAAPQAPMEMVAAASVMDAAAPAATAVEANTPFVHPSDHNELFDLLDAMGGFSEPMRGGGLLAGGVVTEKAEVSAAEEADAAVDMVTTAVPEANAAPKESGGYSDTNVQVAGVDEADIVKTDGEYIYYLANGELFIVKADGKATKLVSRTPYTDEADAQYWSHPSEMFVKGDTLALIVHATNMTWTGSSASDATYAVFYDISDRTAPKAVERLGQSGYYVSSRMVGEMLYLVTTQRIRGGILRDDPNTFCPVLYTGDAAAPMAAESIAVNEQSKRPVYTVVSAVDVEKRAAHKSVKAVLGGAGEIYADGEYLLVASSENLNETSDIHKDENGKNVQITTSKQVTSLVLFALNGGDIEEKAAGSIRGRLLNQFAMDHHKDTFRFVTTVNEWEERIYTDGVDTYEWEDTQANALYTLDENLQMLGSIEELAKEEHVESVRFDGDIAYFVTFRQVDPLFTVDLSDPKNPKILSELKIPGFSEYLHPFGDGRLLGIGYAADENTGRTYGVKLSMFDVADPKNVTECAVTEVRADWQAVGDNHHAILVSVGRNIIAFPTDTGYFVFSYTDEKGFDERAKIDLGENAWSGQSRGLFIGDWLYVISEAGVQVVSMDDFSLGMKLNF